MIKIPYEDKILEALRERGHSDDEILAMAPKERFREFCAWEGLIGYADMLLEVWEVLQHAPLAKYPALFDVDRRKGNFRHITLDAGAYDRFHERIKGIPEDVLKAAEEFLAPLTDAQREQVACPGGDEEDEVEGITFEMALENPASEVLNYLFEYSYSDKSWEDFRRDRDDYYKNTYPAIFEVARQMPFNGKEGVVWANLSNETFGPFLKGVPAEHLAKIEGYIQRLSTEQRTSLASACLDDILQEEMFVGDPKAEDIAQELDEFFHFLFNAHDITWADRNKRPY